MSAFMSSFNAVAPISVIVIAGIFLRKHAVIDERFIIKANVLVFKIAFPVLMVKEVAAADLSGALNFKMIGYACAGVIIETVLLCLTVPRFIEDNRRRSAFIQAAFRGNYTLLGIALGSSLLGSDGIIGVVVLLPFIIPLFTICCISVMVIYSPNNDGTGITMKAVAGAFLNNPPLWGIIAGILIKLSGAGIPFFINSAMNQIAAIATPLALITLGGQLDISSLKTDLRSVAVCSFLKLVAMPALFFTPALFMGFNRYEIGALFFTFSTPVAVNCFAMAIAMDSDSKFMGQMIVISTLLSFFTMFVQIYILTSLGIF